MDLLQKVNEFLKAIEEGKTGEDLAVFYAPGAEQIEYPNQLVKNGATRDVASLKEASERGKKVMISQRYNVQRSYVNGNTVIIEAIWTGVIAIPLGNIPAGGEMKAWYAQFYEFEGDKIIRQRNYNCFAPFS